MRARANQHSALVRNDCDGLEVRRFATAAEATAVARVRDLPEPAEVAAIAGRMGGMMRASRFAREVGVHPRTVRRMYARGALPGAREDGPKLLKVPAWLLRLVAAYGLRGVERLAEAGQLPGTRPGA